MLRQLGTTDVGNGGGTGDEKTSVGGSLSNPGPRSSPKSMGGGSSGCLSGINRVVLILAVTIGSTCGVIFYSLYLISPLGTVGVGSPMVRGQVMGGAGAIARMGGAMELNPLSESSSGKLFKMKRKREYKGSRVFSGGKALGEGEGVLGLLGKKCSMWAVVTTIFPPTQTIRDLGNLTDWCVVVAGDKKTPKVYDVGEGLLGHVVYLSPSRQEQMPYLVKEHLEWNHFGRKNLGFVYAIHHGAQVIYDVDDDNVLINPQQGPISHYLLTETQQHAQPQTQSEVQVAWASNDHHLLNPYPFFHPTANHTQTPTTNMWPRGFPLDFIKDSNTIHTRRPNSNPNPIPKPTPKPKSSPNPWAPGRIGMVQSLANHDPDVDAVYRRGLHCATYNLLQQIQASNSEPKLEDPIEGVSCRLAVLVKRLTRALPVEFSEKNTLLALPPGKFAPTNAQAALYGIDSFWGLMLPVSVHGRVTDIWRSYLTERLMWDIGLVIAFAPPFVNQFRNPHSYLADFESELPLYLQASALTAFLLEWKSSESTLPGRVEDLLITMFEYGILGARDVKLTQAFLRDLLRIGYVFPKVDSDKLFSGGKALEAGVVDGRRDGDSVDSVSDSTTVLRKAPSVLR